MTILVTATIDSSAKSSCLISKRIRNERIRLPSFSIMAVSLIFVDISAKFLCKDTNNNPNLNDLVTNLC